ncbi:hypothetical protein BDQ17DRAFT_1429753 [Cyathus striatus]|nr:hypothetical protein BDQ17DRAFT_1429753 [Cyathus striatus]
MDITNKALPTLSEDILRIIFHLDVLSPRDKVNIACTSKEFKALAFNALLSEVIWKNVLSVQRTLKAWTTVYSEHTNLITKLTIDIPYVNKIMEDQQLLESYGMGPGPAAIAHFMTRLSRLRRIEVLSDARFCWWNWLSAFSNVSSLRSLSLIIAETGTEHRGQPFSNIPKNPIELLNNEKFSSWNQLDNLHISIRVKGNTTSIPFPSPFAILYPSSWIQRFLNIPTIRCLSLQSGSLERIIRPEMKSFLNLNFLRISATVGEKDAKTDNLLKALATLREDVHVCLRLSPAKTTYIPLNPDSGPHEKSHSEICTLEVDGPVGLSVHV